MVNVLLMLSRIEYLEPILKKSLCGSVVIDEILLDCLLVYWLTRPFRWGKIGSIPIKES